MRPEGGGQKYEYKALGAATRDFGYEKAKEAAEHWFKLRTEGVKTDEVETVGAACRAYVKERRASKSEDCAHDAEKRFERTVYDKTMGRKKLAKLRPAKIREWRDSLDLSLVS